MKQKQTTIWSTCYSKGVLDSSEGPFFLPRRRDHSRSREAALRLSVCMMAVFAVAQMLNLVQAAVIPVETPTPHYTNNVISSWVNEGFFGNPMMNQPELSWRQAELSGGTAGRVLGIRTVRAAESLPYQAELVDQAFQKISIQAGKSFTFEARFRNTGSATWTNTGKHFVALNVTDPAGRHSVFQHVFWKDYYYRPARLRETSVKPGEIGTVRFAMTAPQQAGQYTERFGLVAEHLTWLTGGAVGLNIVVTPKPPAYRAEQVGQSASQISVAPGDIFTVWADFKNTGTATWTNTGKNFMALNVTNPVGRDSVFRQASWNEYSYRPTRLDTAVVRPGEIGRFEFTLQAPLQPGEYTEQFAAVAEHLTWVAGTDVTLRIVVEKPVTTERPNEPDIRVGLFTTDAPVVISSHQAYEIVDGSGVRLAQVTADTSTTVTYSEGQYSVLTGTETLISDTEIRILPQTGDAVFEILSYEHRPAWNEELNDNTFRGQLEIRYADATERLWVINQLPLEYYLRGIAEASNDNPPEYLQALYTAARTYAMYHIERNTKHADEHFTVDAEFDQVYRGYNFELRSPIITDAVEATAGQIVTYQNELAITPYFSHSDGRTRAWEEVWSGGPYAWLISVPDPASAGMEMLGHGVGMSALGARSMAEAGSLSEQILGYYYPGTGIGTIY